MTLARPARADNQYLEIPPITEAEASPAYRYANLSNTATLAELRRRRLPFREVEAPLPGVRLPIRLTGKVRGVWIHSSLPEDQREDSLFEILDGRLALALDDFCAILAQHDIIEIVHFTMYRPSTTYQPRGLLLTRHPGGLAIDVGGLKKKNGQWLAIGPHWPAQQGARTCGAKGRKIKSRGGRELISIVCEAYDLRLFHYALTPHFDDAHSDHLHLEIKPGVKWYLYN